MKTLFQSLWIVLAVVSGVLGRTLLVPDDYETIQGAINTSRNDDTVQVRPGNYDGGFGLNGRRIVLRGSPDDPDQTIISAGGICFTNRETERTVLSGFLIRDGSEIRGGG